MKPVEKKLVRLYNRLSESDRDSVLSYAEFLGTRANNSVNLAELTPEIIPRPETETVVAAIKRLSKSYSMLDSPKLLNETSALMSQHIMQGRAVDEVINELEGLFKQQFDVFFEEQSSLEKSTR